MLVVHDDGTKDHPRENIIGYPFVLYLTRKQLASDVFVVAVSILNCPKSNIELQQYGCDGRLLIYKVKLDEYGDVLKNKARLVAKGYRQEGSYAMGSAGCQVSRKKVRRGSAQFLGDDCLAGHQRAKKARTVSKQRLYTLLCLA
ncbi:hypothetical protein Tco_1265590 [Tanacetum coccineum]